MATRTKLDAGHALLILDVLRGRLAVEEAAGRAGVSLADFRRKRQRYLASKLPPARSTLRTGVARPVRIVRDAGWVPHIYAETTHDLFFGQGFAMAQDRLWQLDYLRRRALGRLAEVLGPEAVPQDRTSRILGFGRLADQELAGLGAEPHEALTAFAAGVNAWIAACRDHLPVEFEILEYEPASWTPRDSLALQRALLWQLTGRLENLAAGEAARRFLSDAQAADFLRTESPDETILPGAPGSPASRGATGGDDGSGGSNNWAVAPARSRSGQAMLATDPHLPFALPTGLYQAHLEGAGYRVAGANFPGWPGIEFGHTDRIAWGITNLVASPRDLYVETLEPGHPERYRQGDGWVPFECRVEEIAVRGASLVRVEVRATVRGPIVDELVPALGPPDGSALSLRWVGQERLDDLQALLDLDRAHDWPSFRRAAAAWRLPVFNLLYADVDGHIGWQAVGSVPIRGAGDESRGYRPANDAAHAWRGYVAFEDLPWMLDPARGWVGTANNRPVDDRCPHPLYGWWAPGHRAVRIGQLLERQPRFDADDFRRMQFDAYSVRAEQLAGPLGERLRAAGDDAADRVAAWLEGWDGQCIPDSVAATVFETFFELWHQRVLEARFPEEVLPFLTALGAGSGLALRLITEDSPADWLGEQALGAALARVARDTVDELGRRGRGRRAWRWGATHRVTFRHPLDGRPGTAGLFATRPAEAHGTGHALNNTGYAHGRRFDVVSGPEFRMVVDFADLDGTTTVLTTGQSGQPGSPHYVDHLRRWLRGESFRLPWRWESVEADAIGEIRLEPDGG